MNQCSFSENKQVLFKVDEDSRKLSEVYSRTWENKSITAGEEGINACLEWLKLKVIEICEATCNVTELIFLSCIT